MPAEEAAAWLDGFNPQPISDEKVEVDRHDPTFPVRVPLCSGAAQPCLGWLLVGPRPDGTPLGEDERETLVEIADPIARAVRIVMKRDTQEREVADLLDAHRRRIEELEARLGDRPAGYPAAVRK